MLKANSVRITRWAHASQGGHMPYVQLNLHGYNIRVLQGNCLINRNAVALSYCYIDIVVNNLQFERRPVEFVEHWNTRTRKIVINIR